MIIEFPKKETKEPGKYEGRAEAMEVSLEVGISLEPDSSPTTDGLGNHLQSCLLLPNVHGSSAENRDLLQSMKLSFVSNEGNYKM